MGSKGTKALLIAAAAFVACIIVAVLLLFSSNASWPERQKAEPSFAQSSGVSADAKGISLLLRFVPTDAIAVRCFSNAGSGIPCTFGTGCEYAALGLEDFEGCSALVSLHYLGSMSSLLVLDLGRCTKDFQQKVDRLETDIAGLGLEFRYFAPSQDRTSRGVMLVSRSSNVIESAVLHRERGASLQDAEGFDDALQLLPLHSDAVVVDPRYLGKLIDKSVLSERFDGRARASALKFISSCATWVVAVASDDEADCYDLFPVIPDDGTSYLSAIGVLRPCVSCIGGILPPAADYVIGMTLPSLDDFVPSLERYLDANGRLVAFGVRCSDFKKRVKCSPSALFESMEAKEIAKICCSGREVLAVRTGKGLAEKVTARPADIAEGARILFGDEFGIPAAEDMVVEGDFLVIGADAASFEFPDPQEQCGSIPLLSKGMKMYIHSEVADLCWSRGGMKMKIN
ncbi:MAG: hypothetical protein MJY43_04220 [Bacteroidales bacterium]|nr:hypothetical protein [Bacteroidales bacterium]